MPHADTAVYESHAPISFGCLPVPPRHSQVKSLSYVDSTGLHRVAYLGAALARSEIRITLGALLDRFEEIELDGVPPRFQDRLTLCGLPYLKLACKESSVRAAKPAARERQPEAPPAEASTVATRAQRGLRPGATDALADVRWRASLRERIETAPTRADSLPIVTGERLDATAALLKRNALFAACSAEDLRMLASTANPMSFEPGDMLCIEGAEANETYVVALGQAVVSIAGKGMGRIKEDDVVGEVGVLLDTRRSATVTAIEHMITYAISRDRLQSSFLCRTSRSTPPVVSGLGRRLV